MRYNEIEVSEIEELSREQIEEGDCNDSPNTVFQIRLPGGEEGWVAGPHGVSCCAISDWLQNVGKPAKDRESAIAGAE